MIREYTDPSVLDGIAAGASWADPTMDPTTIDWPARQAAAMIPFEVVGGRPVNPCEKTSVRYGRNELGHWGEAVAADAIVTAVDECGIRYLLMVERDDGHGWALPGGHVDPGETPVAAALRELREETGLDRGYVAGARSCRQLPPRYVPDPRASDEAWMVTVPFVVEVGQFLFDEFPAVVGADDAVRAEWVLAGSYGELEGYLAAEYRGVVFPAHRDLLREVLG